MIVTIESVLYVVWHSLQKQRTVKHNREILHENFGKITSRHKAVVIAHRSSRSLKL